MKKIFRILLIISTFLIYININTNSIFALGESCIVGGHTCAPPEVCTVIKVAGGAICKMPAAAAVGATAPTALTGLSSPCDIGVSTALGGIPTDPACLAKWILKYGIIIGSGVAFLLCLSGGASIIFAGGNPEKIQQGKQIITSALTGLLFIIFSLFLLRFIGFNVLQLPGFGNS